MAQACRGRSSATAARAGRADSRPDHGRSCATAALASVNSTKADATPSLAGAGLDLVFISARTDASYDLYEATRTDAGATFGAPAALTMLNTTGHEGGPWLSEDRRTLLFESDRSGQNEIYMTTR